jgi:hypothetical protein
MKTGCKHFCTCITFYSVQGFKRVNFQDIASATGFASVDRKVPYKNLIHKLKTRLKKLQSIAGNKTRVEPQKSTSWLYNAVLLAIVGTRQNRGTKHTNTDTIGCKEVA